VLDTLAIALAAALAAAFPMPHDGLGVTTEGTGLGTGTTIGEGPEGFWVMSAVGDGGGTIGVAIGVAPALVGTSSSGAVLGVDIGPFPWEVAASGTISHTGSSGTGGDAPPSSGAVVVASLASGAAVAAPVEGAGSVGPTYTAGWVIGWVTGAGVGLVADSGVGSGARAEGGLGAEPGFESAGDGTERAVPTGTVSADGVVELGTGSATLPLIIVTLSAVPGCDVWEGCSAARASPVASTKTTKHKASATAKATIFQVN
jgi:hypothetical protein